MTGREPPPGSSRDRGPLADPGSLRRIELLAAGWTLAGAAGLLAAGSPAGALVLTGSAAVAIVAFRGLQRIVSALGPRPEAPAGAPAEASPRRAGAAGWIGRHPGLAAMARLGALGALLAAGWFLLGRDLFPAIVLGYSTLPAALMTEGLLQAVRAFRGKDSDCDGGS